LEIKQGADEHGENKAYKAGCIIMGCYAFADCLFGNRQLSGANRRFLRE